MPEKVPKGPEAIFGSRARGKILALLASTREPQTGYAIAKALGIGVSNAYPELERLEGWEIVASRPDPKGNTVYSLADDDLRKFLQRRVRVLSSKDWFAADRVSQREKAAKEVERIDVRLPKVRLKRKDRPFKSEFERPLAKDRVLRRLNKSPSGAP